MASVLQDWVMNISLRQQGVLLLALRGPDGAPKEDVAKPLVRALRAVVMVSGRVGKAMAMGLQWKDDPFMSTALIGHDLEEVWEATVHDFFSSIDQYNIHFLQHLWHAYAVVGINHPFIDIKRRAWWVYLRGCRALHMWPETPDQMIKRLRDGIRSEEGED